MNEQLTKHLQDYYQWANGLRDLLKDTSSYTDQIPKKMQRMQEIYLQRNPSLYSVEDTKKLKYYMQAIFYKEFLCDFITDEVWGFVRTGSDKRTLIEVLNNSFDDHNTTDTDIIALSSLLDSFLVQGAAFVDLFLLYLCVFFQIEVFPLWEKLSPALREMGDPLLKSKAERIVEILERQMFSGVAEVGTLSVGDWGNLIRDLRHAVVHRDRIFPSFEKGETLTQKKTSNWTSELKEIEINRFCEDVRGGMFLIHTQVTPILFELEWIPGPFRSNLWKFD